MWNELYQYSDTLYSNTPATLAGVPLPERHVVYERRHTGLDNLDVWLPLDRDLTDQGAIQNTLPLYIVFRGTDSFYEGMVDIQLLHDHATGVPYHTGYNTLLTPILNEVYSVINATTRRFIFISHSLGSMFALRLWHSLWTYPGNPYGTRMLYSENIMFNPFIVIDNIFTASLELANNSLFASNFHSHIVEYDIFASLWKKHGFGQKTIYGSLVLENSNDWYSYTDFISASLSWTQYLNMGNHTITAFLQNTDIGSNNYPLEIFLHYVPDPATVKHIQTRRTYDIHINENGQDELLQNEHLQLRLHKENNVHSWRLSNININSETQPLSEFDMSILYSGEPNLMIYFNHMWSLPFIINQDNNGERFYIFRSQSTIQIDPLYYVAKVSNNILYFLKPYADIAGNDITWYLHRQKEEDIPAYQLVQKASLEASILIGLDSIAHKLYEYTIGMPTVPNHSGYIAGTRRNISNLTLVLPKHHIILQSQTNDQYLAGYYTDGQGNNTIEIAGHALYTYSRSHWASQVDNNVEGDAINSTYPDEYVWHIEQNSDGTWKMTNTESNPDLSDVILDNLTITFADASETLPIFGHVAISNSSNQYLTAVDLPTGASNWALVQWTSSISQPNTDWRVIVIQSF